MAISKATKTAQVAELTDLLESAKMTVGAKYTGLSVADLQLLRAKAREAGVVIKIVKNRLVRIAMNSSKTYAKTDTSLLGDQLLYAVSDSDEVAPAQVLAQFKKEHSALNLICGFDADGNALDTARVTELANLPSKDVLLGMLVGAIGSPLSGLVSVLSGNTRSVLTVLNARAEQLEAK